MKEDTSNKLNIDFDEIYQEWEEYQYTKFEDEEDIKEPNYQKYFLENNNIYLEIVKFLNILLKTYWTRYIYEDDVLSYSLRPNWNIRNFYEIKKRLIELELIQEFDEIKINKNGEVIKITSTLSQVNKDKVINLNRIYPNEDIKRLIIPKEYNKNVSLKLNLNLPKNELIAYISKIKDDFDKDNSIIKTPLELLGETLEKSDNKRTPKKPKAFVYADWFYIYDYWKYEKTQGKTDKDIFVALEVENNVPYKEDMIRKIRDKMKYFIDDLGYKELITGVKNS